MNRGGDIERRVILKLPCSMRAVNFPSIRSDRASARPGITQTRLQFLVLETEAQQPVTTQTQQRNSSKIAANHGVFLGQGTKIAEPVANKRERERRDRAGKDVMRDPQ
jgi:hypothetical protein